MSRPRFQFRLRTLFVVVTAWALLLSQWPLVEYVEPEYGPSGFSVRARLFVDGNYEKIGGDYYCIPRRVLWVCALEAAALVGWIVWRRVRRPATKS